MTDECRLRAANGIHDEQCDGTDCVYWRALSHLGTPVGEGCAIDHYELLGDEKLAKWLLTVKQRLEAANCASESGSDAERPAVA